MIDTIMAATAVVDVLLLGLGSSILSYIIRLESRLTKIETKLNID